MTETTAAPSRSHEMLALTNPADWVCDLPAGCLTAFRLALRIAGNRVFSQIAVSIRAGSLVMSQDQTGQLDTVMQEARKFPPPKEFSEHARIKSLAHYEAMWKQAADDIEAFWGREAGALHWF